jgi:hypothetical protein
MLVVPVADLRVLASSLPSALSCSTKVKIYGGAGATVEEVRQEHAVVIPKFMRHLAPEHQRITQSVVTFHAITAGVQPSGIFYPASTCAC